MKSRITLIVIILGLIGYALIPPFSLLYGFFGENFNEKRIEIGLPLVLKESMRDYEGSGSIIYVIDTNSNSTYYNYYKKINFNFFGFPFSEINSFTFDGNFLVIDYNFENSKMEIKHIQKDSLSKILTYNEMLNILNDFKIDVGLRNNTTKSDITIQ